MRRGYFSDDSRRRRGCISPTTRGGGAAAATWILPRRRVARLRYNPPAWWAVLKTAKARLPPLKWIYLSRDPFNQLSTCMIRKRCGRRKEDYYADAHKWKSALTRAPLRDFSGFDICYDDYALIARAATSLLPKLPKHDVLGVKYEDFTARPQEKLKALCKFLGVKCSDAWLDDAAAQVRPSSNSSKYVAWAATKQAKRTNALIASLPANLLHASYRRPELARSSGDATRRPARRLSSPPLLRGLFG